MPKAVIYTWPVKRSANMSLEAISFRAQQGRAAAAVKNHLPTAGGTRAC
jgi:hypothetical protein